MQDWIRLRSRTIPTSLQRPKELDAKTHAFSCLTVQDRTDPWIKEKIIKRSREFVNVFFFSQESGQTHHRPHPQEQVRMRPDHTVCLVQRRSGARRPKDRLEVGTQSAASSSFSGWPPSACWQSSSWSQHGHRHQNGVCDNFFFFANQSVSLTSNDDSLVRDGHRTHVRTRDFFSIDSRPESSSQVHVSLAKTVILTSSTACRTRLRCCFLRNWALPHFPFFPFAILSDLLLDRQAEIYWCHLHTGIFPVPIHRMCLSVQWLTRHPLTRTEQNKKHKTQNTKHDTTGNDNTQSPCWTKQS